MPDEKPKRSGIEKIAEEAFTPAATEFGKEIAPLGKAAGALTTRVGLLLLAPVEGVVYGLEKARAVIERAVAERLKDVPQEKIVEPQPRIAVPAIQALTYSLDEKYIAEMFANLLAADMNADTKKDVHPAFVEFIKEMTSAEAKLLLAMEKRHHVKFQVRFGAGPKYINQSCTYSFVADGVHIDDYARSLDNLQRLGLIVFKVDYPEIEGLEEMTKGAEALCQKEFEKALRDEAIQTELKRIPNAKAYVDRSGIWLTDLGRAFVKVCMKGLK